MSYCHHVVTLHVWLVFILALIVELPEEVESHHSVEIDDHGQQTHSQHKLEGEKSIKIRLIHALKHFI